MARNIRLRGWLTPSTQPTGVRGRARRLWIPLLMVLALAIGFGLSFGMRPDATPIPVIDEDQQARSLEAYTAEIKALLANRGSRTSPPDDERWRIANERTLSTLRTLDGEQKGTLLRFLQESKLISSTGPVINLGDADLRGADLQDAHLQTVKLDHAQLADANLRGAHLAQAHLVEAGLRGADFRGADLRDTHLAAADLMTFADQNG